MLKTNEQYLSDYAELLWSFVRFPKNKENFTNSLSMETETSHIYSYPELMKI